MIKEIFVQQFYPLAQAAGKLFNINPVVVLAQAAIESGWAESRLSKDYNSFFGITGYGMNFRCFQCLFQIQFR